MHLIKKLLSNETDKEKKKNYIMQALQQTDGIDLPINLIKYLLEELQENSKPEQLIFKENDIDTLKQAEIDIIHKAIKDETLEKTKNLARVLHAWREFESIHAVRIWVKDLVRTEAGVWVFLHGFSVTIAGQWKINL